MNLLTQKELKWNLSFLKIAEIIAEHSTCAKVKVGAVLVKDGRIISVGFNGVPSGINPHCNELFDSNILTGEVKVIEHNDFKSSEIKRHTEFQLANEIHAEINCIGYAAQNGINTNGAIMYTTLSPCMDCCKAMIAAGIKEIYYIEEYRNIEGLKLLVKCGIKFKSKKEISYFYEKI